MHRAHFEVVADVDQRHWWFLARRRILRDVLACVLPPDRDSTIIDVGCGTGANIAALAHDYRCIGIDTSADAIAIAQQRFPDVRFICGSAPKDLGDSASKAKAMLLMDVLEHVPDDRAVFEPLALSLRPGAIMLVTVPADMRLWSPHDEGVLHHRRYDEAMMRELWRGLPVEVMGLTHFCSRLYPIARISRALSRFKRRMFNGDGADWDMAVPVRPINQLMQRAFEGESRTLTSMLRQGRSHAYACGVSLLALLRRTDGASALHRNGHGAVA